MIKKKNYFRLVDKKIKEAMRIKKEKTIRKNLNQMVTFEMNMLLNDPEVRPYLKECREAFEKSKDQGYPCGDTYTVIEKAISPHNIELGVRLMNKILEQRQARIKKMMGK